MVVRFAVVVITRAGRRVNGRGDFEWRLHRDSFRWLDQSLVGVVPCAAAWVYRRIYHLAFVFFYSARRLTANQFYVSPRADAYLYRTWLEPRHE